MAGQEVNRSGETEVFVWAVVPSEFSPAGRAPTSRVDTRREAEWVRCGGVPPYVLSDVAAT